MKFKLMAVMLSASLFSTGTMAFASPNHVKETADFKYQLNQDYVLYKKDGVVFEPIRGSVPSIKFLLKNDKTLISGYSGCNSFNGFFEKNELNTYKADKSISTRKACMNDIAKIESVVLRSINTWSTWMNNGNNIIIQSKNATLEFKLK